MPKLTKRFVESLRPGTLDQVIFDDELPGFGLRLFKSGKRSYVVQYRNAQGRSRRMTLGLHGKITAEQARLLAHRVFAKVRAQGRARLGGRPPPDNRVDCAREGALQSVPESCAGFSPYCNQVKHSYDTLTVFAFL